MEYLQKDKLRIYLAHNFEKLSQSQKQQLVINIEKQIVLVKTSLPEENINLLETFIDNVPENIIGNELSNSSESIGYLFDKIFDYLIDNADEEYFTQIFPLIKKYLKYVKSQKLSLILWDSCQKHISVPYTEFYNIMHQCWKDLNQEIWAENDNAQQIFDFTIQELQLKYGIMFGSEIFDSVPDLHTDVNYKLLFDKTFSLKNNIIEIHSYLLKYDRVIYSDIEIAEFGSVLDADVQKEYALRQLWEHWLRILEDERIVSIGKIIISNIEIFRVYQDCVRNVKQSSELIILIIKDILNEDLKILLQLINNVSMQLAGIFPYGKERETLAKFFIENIQNIKDDESAKAVCSFAKLLYTDILREVDLRKYRSDNRTKDILKEIFPDNKKLKKLEGEADKT